MTPRDGGEEAHALATRADALDWKRIEAELDSAGCALTGPLLDGGTCAALRALYPEDAPFRSRVVMARHGFGQGEYKYFAYPLPEPIAALRAPLYSRLVPIANRWNEAMGLAVRYPPSHGAFLEKCREAGQTRPTPLLLKYGPGDYNCLHQDLYGETVFPLQIAILLSEPNRDFTGGEFVLTSNVRECSPAWRWCRYVKARASSSPSTTGPCKERAASTASTCATA